jgi:hypothetical protein
MKLENFDLHRVLFLGGSLSLIIIYILSWVDVITDPTQRTASDFMAFYAAGRNALEHTAAEAYDIGLTKANEEKILGYRIADQDVNFLVHPPLILPILWLIARFEYVPAFYLWASFLLILCVLCAYMTAKISQISQAVEGVNQLVLWWSTFLFFPLFISVVNGQTSAMLLLGILLWYYGLVQNSGRVAGLGLALATISPQIALVLAIPFFFNATYRKVWWWFCIGGLILAGLSIAMVGVEGVKNYFHILSLSASGEGYHTNESAMVNLIGLIKRLLPTIGAASIRMAGWAGSLIGLIILNLVWWKSSNITHRHVSLAVILAVLTSPHLHYHDLALLIVPTFVAMQWLITARKASIEFASLLLLYLSFIFLLTYSAPQLKYTVIYLVELALLAPVWLMDRIDLQQNSNTPQ